MGQHSKLVLGEGLCVQGLGVEELKISKRRDLGCLRVRRGVRLLACKLLYDTV